MAWCTAAQAPHDQEEPFDDMDILSHESKTEESDVESDAKVIQTAQLLYVPGPTADILELCKVRYTSLVILGFWLTTRNISTFILSRHLL